MSQFKTFKALHEAKNLFVLPNAWDAESARILEQTGFQTIATSSAAVATSLGYDDGEQMPFQDYLFVIKRIAATTKLPFTVDMEMGYGHTPEEVYANLATLAQLGIAGVNIEDSQIKNSKRALQPAEEFVTRLTSIKNRLVANGVELFINVRSDTYLLRTANALQESQKRANLYASTGADGLFFPCIVNNDDIKTVAAATALPLNVMCMPGLADFDTLASLGVKRVSLGSFLFDRVYKQVDALGHEIIRSRSVASLT